MIPGAGKPPVLPNFLCLVHGFFGDPDFRCHFCQIFSWTSVKTLVLKSVGHDEQIGPLLGSNEPLSGFPTLFLSKVFMNFRQDIIYGAGWSLREKSAHFKGQTIPEVDF
ncbi:hypothetical protein KY285_007842 [Solanum tuberosum]|nr:hypothetical protein KY285_007840 [Solanum tuberosum]KAH0746185.1 hypothetical protein KY285_007842 [Solanum tuberosum]